MSIEEPLDLKEDFEVIHVAGQYDPVSAVRDRIDQSHQAMHLVVDVDQSCFRCVITPLLG